MTEGFDTSRLALTYLEDGLSVSEAIHQLLSLDFPLRVVRDAVTTAHEEFRRRQGEPSLFDAPGAPGTSKEFRAVLRCTADPCTYCRQPARSITLDAVFDSEENALAYGRRMAANVYGSSVHRASLESRTITEWSPEGGQA